MCIYIMIQSPNPHPPPHPLHAWCMVGIPPSLWPCGAGLSRCPGLWGCLIVCCWWGCCVPRLTPCGPVVALRCWHTCNMHIYTPPLPCNVLPLAEKHRFQDHTIRGGGGVTTCDTGPYIHIIHTHAILSYIATYIHTTIIDIGMDI